MGRDLKEALAEIKGGGYDLEPRSIRMTFLKRQQGIHPDSFAGAGEVTWGISLCRYLSEAKSSHALGGT